MASTRRLRYRNIFLQWFFLPLPVFNFQKVLFALIEHGAVSLHETKWKRRVKNDIRMLILTSSIRQQPLLVWYA
jgi:hypothetical protein